MKIPELRTIVNSLFAAGRGCQAAKSERSNCRGYNTISDLGRAVVKKVIIHLPLCQLTVSLIIHDCQYSLSTGVTCTGSIYQGVFIPFGRFTIIPRNITDYSSWNEVTNCYFLALMRGLIIFRLTWHLLWNSSMTVSRQLSKSTLPANISSISSYREMIPNTNYAGLWFLALVQIQLSGKW